MSQLSDKAKDLLREIKAGKSLQYILLAHPELSDAVPEVLQNVAATTDLGKDEPKPDKSPAKASKATGHGCAPSKKRINPSDVD